MIRSIALILKVLALAAPHYRGQTEAAWLLRELGASHRFDPVTLVAIAEHESRWQPAAKSPDGRDFGLAQVRSTTFRACREGRESVGCKAIESVLLEPVFNLRAAAMLIEENREYCKKQIGTELAVYWLQQFQGFGATRHTTCGHVRRRGKWVAVEVPAITLEVLRRRRELVARAQRSES